MTGGQPRTEIHHRARSGRDVLTMDTFKAFKGTWFAYGLAKPFMA